MEGKKVEIQLNTPIMIPLPAEGEGRASPEAVIKLTGIIKQFSQGGLLLHIETLVSEKKPRVVSTHAQIFLPFHKIDHLFILA